MTVLIARLDRICFKLSLLELLRFFHTQYVNHYLFLIDTNLYLEIILFEIELAWNEPDFSPSQSWWVRGRK